MTKKDEGKLSVESEKHSRKFDGFEEGGALEKLDLWGKCEERAEDFMPYFLEYITSGKLLKHFCTNNQL